MLDLNKETGFSGKEPSLENYLLNFLERKRKKRKKRCVFQQICESINMWFVLGDDQHKQNWVYNYFTCF